MKRLKSIHEAGFIHRDLKPANILLGLGKNQYTVYLIDYGLTKRISESVTNTESYSPSTKPKKMAGTPVYASINAHMATGGKISCVNFPIEYLKKDDLESMMYVLV